MELVDGVNLERIGQIISILGREDSVAAHRAAERWQDFTVVFVKQNLVWGNWAYLLGLKGLPNLSSSH